MGSTFSSFTGNKAGNTEINNEKPKTDPPIVQSQTGDPQTSDQTKTGGKRNKTPKKHSKGKKHRKTPKRC